jgi:alpha-L-rhamnosidase
MDIHRTIRPLGLLVACGVCWTAAAPARVEAADKAGPPANLRCEYRINPLGIDVARPRLSWQLQDSRRGAAQTAFQVVVSTDPEFRDPRAVTWDSGKVASDQSIHVVYAGRPLQSRGRYCWKVRTWDAAGKPTEYAQPAWWEMGLLNPADWKARWITREMPVDSATQALAAARWIWNAQALGDDTTAWFRRSFIIADGRKIRHAEARFATDNTGDLYVNGTLAGHQTDFKQLHACDVTARLRPGPNTLALKCWNANGPAGLLLVLQVTFEDGQELNLGTDGGWKTFTAAAEPSGWTGVAFDDAAWDAAKVVAAFGDAPWKELRPRTGPRRSFCVRDEFQLRAQPTRARAYVTGLGSYRLLVNGQPVGDQILAPGWTDYRFRVQYQTHDVTPLLNKGPNAVGAILGSGWWSGMVGWSGPELYSKGNLRFLMQLVVEYADGGEDVVITDDSWKTRLSPVLSDSIYNGETYDARMEMPGWASPGFDAGGWTDARIVPEADQRASLDADRCPPIRVTEELKPAWVSEPEKDVFIFDFGQNASGVARLKVKGAAAGARIRLRFCEVLDPAGRVYRDNYRAAQVTDVYICKGSGEEVWEPMFTYRGCRYCEVTGYPGRPPADALTFRVFHTDMPMASTFECSHPMLNQLFRNIVWGQRGNLHSIPTDCPQRDERLGWTGDANVFGATSCWNMDMAAFYHKWMRDVMDSQSPEGFVTDVVPAMSPAGPAAPGWGDACVVTPWNVYQFYGDTRIIEQTYDSMVRWIEYMHANRDPRSGLYEREGYGDWVASVESPKKPIGAAYYHYSTKLVARMAAAIGRKEDAAKYEQRASEIAERFNRAWLDDKTAGYPSGTQTANLLPLHFGIVPPERRQAVAASLLSDIRSRGYHLSTGFLGTAYLMSALADLGEQETAYRLAVQTTCPSWGYMLLNGATTIWERWDTDKWGPDMNSRNHYAFGAVGSWLLEDVAGINIDPAAPGFKHIIIRPRPAGDLAWAGAAHACMYGDIRSEWRRTAAGFTLDVTIPPNTTARVYVPTLDRPGAVVREGGRPVTGSASEVRPAAAEPGFAAFDVAAGTYHFSVSAP